MKIINRKIILVLVLVVVLGIGFLMLNKEAQAVNITASPPVRITPLCISAGNIWAGAGKYPWSLDGSKIMIFEDQTDDGINHAYRGTRPSTPSVCNHTGRGVVWADVQTIMTDSDTHNYAEAIGTGAADALTALESYKRITHELPNNWNQWVPEWSQVPGQENIIYGIKNNGSTYTLEYIDTTECDQPGESCATLGHAIACNGVSPCTFNCTTAVCGGADYNTTSDAKLFTWTTDNPPRLVSSMPRPGHTSEYFWDGVWMFDVSGTSGTATKTFHSGWHMPGETGWKQFRWFSHGHTATSPDQEAMAYYGNTSYMTCWNESGAPCNGLYITQEFTGVHEPIEDQCKLRQCSTDYSDTTNARLESTHVSWYGDDNYYFAYEAWGEVLAPHIENHDIWLVEYDRVNNTFTSTDTPLLTMRGSASWKKPDGCAYTADWSISYGNSPHGSDKRDGTQLYVFGVGGDYYTRTDEFCSTSGDTTNTIPDVEFERNNGAWLVNLTKSSSDTTPPAVPTGVSVQ